jgi:hypothetical protein
MFTKTQSLNSFAVANGINELDLILNPNTGKLFGKTNTGLTMRVAEKVKDLDGDLSVSWFEPENGEPSWLLHTTGVTNVVSKKTFGVPANTAPVAMEAQV